MWLESKSRLDHFVLSTITTFPAGAGFGKHKQGGLKTECLRAASQ